MAAAVKRTGKYVLMPLRAFFDSDHYGQRILPKFLRVLMPLRAFFDSDLARLDAALLAIWQCLNALTGIF